MKIKDKNIKKFKFEKGFYMCYLHNPPIIGFGKSKLEAYKNANEDNFAEFSKDNDRK